MLGYQFSWRTLFISVICGSSLVSSTRLPNIKHEVEDFNHGPYALRLVSTHPNLTNAFFVDSYHFKENPDSKTITPIWAGASYWQFLPGSSDNLYEGGGAIFLDNRLDNSLSPQLILQYTKGPDELVPFLRWAWNSGPGQTHYFPGNWYVSWGGFRFVKQQDSGKVFLFAGNGTNSAWRPAAEYEPSLGGWSMRNWNSTDPNVALPDNWEFVNVEVIPFEEAGI